MKLHTLAAVLVAMPGWLASAHADCAPRAISGTWEVVDVLVDRQDPMHANYRSGDPRLVGRSLTIEQGKVRLYDAKEPNCPQKTWPRRQTTWGRLFRQSFARAPMGGRSSHPTIEDFGLDVSGSMPVTAYTLCPPPKGSPRYTGEFWVIPHQKDKLLYREDPQYVLVLGRRPAGAMPTAGTFDCAAASTPTEKAICSDHDLAAWDRSVGLGIRQFMESWPEAEPKLRASQAEYLKKRDACGVDAKCINDVISWRVEELIQLIRGVGI